MLLDDTDYSLTQAADSLRKLIETHPDHNIAILAGTDASDGYHTWTYCSDITFSVGEILNAPNMCDLDNFVFTNRDDLREYFEEELYDQVPDGANLDQVVEAKMAMYEKYWEKVIFIRATN